MIIWSVSKYQKFLKEFCAYIWVIPYSVADPHQVDEEPDSDPSFHFDADPDPTFHSDTDPGVRPFNLILIRILPLTFPQILTIQCSNGIKWLQYWNLRPAIFSMCFCIRINDNIKYKRHCLRTPLSLLYRGRRGRLAYDCIRNKPI
jgi:hypothetical protein